MPPSRLTDVDKQEILKLYQRGQETTTTLASRYGVSNSTVIRVLKSFLSVDEYESLVHSKRSNGREKSVVESPPIPTTDLPLELADDPVTEAVAPPTKRVTKDNSKSRSHKTAERASSTRIPDPVPQAETDQLPLLDLELLNAEEPSPVPEPETATPRPKLAVKTNPEAGLADGLSAVEEIMSELRHSVSNEVDEDDEDLDEDFDDEEDDDGLDVDGLDPADLTVLAPTNLEVLPLTEGSLPHTCYVVIDRTAELVTRPLKDFGALGKVPNQAEHDRILPIFDNHRIAKRFSNRNQRIIKVPDGKMLSKAALQLQAKGITRLLIDGRVYTLAE